MYTVLRSIDCTWWCDIYFTSLLFVLYTWFSNNCNHTQFNGALQVPATYQQLWPCYGHRHICFLPFLSKVMYLLHTYPHKLFYVHVILFHYIRALGCSSDHWVSGPPESVYLRLCCIHSCSAFSLSFKRLWCSITSAFKEYWRQT